MNGKREYGDYQTPIDFSDRVCIYLNKFFHVNPSAIVEPTCGIGNFLKSSLLFNANEYYGIEINPDHCEKCKKNIDNEKVKIINSDFFAFSSISLIKDKRQILIIGNPPWVTNSTLATLNSANLPKKANFKGFKGIDAITGASNFDICEYIILNLVYEYMSTDAIIAMLCKTSVARNVFKELKRNCISFSSFDILEFDSSKVFGINASACVLVIHLEDSKDAPDVCNVYDFDYPEVIKSHFVYVNGQLYNDSGSKEESFYGQSCFEWRQGIKHDCSQVMELTMCEGILRNGRNESVYIEDDIVFPLIKSSMFKKPIINSFSKYVIVTQKKVREGTTHLKEKVPKTWEYLNDNINLFEKRKSSIYRDAPPFSMFGIGDYSYSRYKVGVSGFYKKPLFSVLYSNDNKPVMIDDTSYFICFDSYDMAYVAMLLLNSEKVQNFIMNMAFLDSKRPYTKKVLERIDFDKISSSMTFNELVTTERSLNLSYYVTLSMYDTFKSSLNLGQMSFT